MKASTVLPLSAEDPVLDDFRKVGADAGEIVVWSNHPVMSVRRNRIRLLTSYPLLVPDLVDRHYADLYPTLMQIRVAVDRGLPMSALVADVFRVSKSTAQFFYDTPLSHFCEEHHFNPRYYLRCLDVIPESSRPRSRADWQTAFRFYRYVYLNTPSGNLIGFPYRYYFCRHLYASLCRLGYSSNSECYLDSITANQPDKIRFVTDYFDFVALWSVAIWPGCVYNAKSGDPSAPWLPELFLMRFSIEDLIRQSDLWHREMASDTKLVCDAGGKIQEMSEILRKVWPDFDSAYKWFNDAAHLIIAQRVCGNLS